MKLTVIAAFAASALVAGVLTFSQDSVAYERRMNAAYCHPALGASVYTSNGNDSTTNSVVVGCPVPDDTSMMKKNSTHLNVHGYDGSSTYAVWASRCLDYAFSNGGICGPAASSSGPGVGNFTLSPALSVWSGNVVDFGYVQVILPPKTPNKSNIRGYWMSN